jgi:radical SAM protein with 4Fe4S-binding SPASM domain
LACNSHCIHCGSDARTPRKNELSTEEAIDFVHQIKEVGFKRLILSGGEPTLRQDWVRIAEEAKTENLEVGILSNALAWTPKTIDALASLRPFAVGFSVDGEPELHDYLRGAEGSHQKVFDVIHELKKRDIPVCAVTAVNKRNLGSLFSIRNRLIVYDVDAWQIQVAFPMGRMASHRDLILDAHEYYQLGEFIAETRERLHRMNVQGADCMGYYGQLGQRVRENEWQGCLAGIESIGVESDGTVKGCLAMRILSCEGNIREKSLREIWEDSNNFKYSRQFNVSSLKGDCRGCNYGTQCRGGCQTQSTAFFQEFHHAPYCFLRYEQGGK